MLKNNLTPNSRDKVKPAQAKVTPNFELVIIVDNFGSVIIVDIIGLRTDVFLCSYPTYF